MFYSHEILTSRKYGVATVWLVATLGAKSTLRKVNRKAILEVNVPKACETIIAPEAPMALRLQSNLLYGVSRVYSQQCGYVLSDVQSAHNSMRALFRIVNTADIDTEVGRVRPEQLLLSDDPSFLPDFALAPPDFDLSNLEHPPSSSTQRGDILSPLASHQSDRGLQATAEPVRGLVLPTSDSGVTAGVGGFAFPGGEAADTSAGEPPSGILQREDDGGFLPDVDFTFDAEGNLFELPVAERLEQNVSAERPTRRTIGSDAAMNQQVRQEHEEGQRAGIQVGEQMDMDVPFTLADYDVLPSGEAFAGPTMNESQDENAITYSPHPVQEEEGPEAAGAPTARKTKRRRAIRIDETAELRNTNLSQWNSQYLTNMAEAATHRLHQRAAMQAKKNAEYWVLGTGIGGIGPGLGESTKTSLLEMFAGMPLLQLLTGTAPSTGQKRDRSAAPDEGSDSEGRRVRPRADEEDQGIRDGDDLAQDDMDMARLVEDDAIELGREAPSAMDDFSSAMPWNITASARGSSLPRNAPLPGSAGGPGSAGAPGSLGARPATRLVNASPLVGRGRPSGASSGIDVLPSMDFSELPSDLPGHDLPHDDEGHGIAPEEFELYGAAAGMDTQTAAQSQWTRDALDRESMNFLTFIEAALSRKRDELADAVQQGEVEEEEAAQVSFADLLPPESNSRIVAAQALLHTLALATKNLIVVRQSAAFGEIRMTMVTT